MKFILSTLILVTLLSCATNKDKDQESATVKKAKLYYNKGTADLLNKDYTIALKHLLDSHALNPNDSKTLNNLGMAYYFKKRPQTAIRFIKKSIEIDPKNTDARMNLATIYTNSNELNEAEKQYMTVLDDLTYQGQYKTYYNLALLHLKKNQRAKALTYFKQSLNENSQYCPAHYKLGEMFFNKGQYNLALDKFKSASAGVCYDNPMPVYHQAVTYMKLKEFGTAKLKLEEILERFSLTKYETMARKKLKVLSNIQQRQINQF